MTQPSPKSLFIPFQPVEFCFPDVFQPSVGVNEVLPCEAGLDDTHCYLFIRQQFGDWALIGYLILISIILGLWYTVSFKSYFPVLGWPI